MVKWFDIVNYKTYINTSKYANITWLNIMLDSLTENRVDHKKPRHEGITYIIDKFQGFDRENFEIISPL